VSVRIVLATRNQGKIREIRNILLGAAVELIDAGAFPAYQEPPEDGDTFLENALSKAMAAHKATGLPALADDSGIEVDALGGAPGVRSARFGGKGLTDAERAHALLDALRGVPPENRGARFRCVMVLYPVPSDEGGRIETEGFLYGRIAEQPAGENGFGYDPVFIPDGGGRTLAQMAPEDKNAISHRYRALVEMKWLLVRMYNTANA
jgi:XTP/dITP diphosphohydrolase